jgi:hypothetical protein
MADTRKNSSTEIRSHLKFNKVVKIFPGGWIKESEHIRAAATRNAGWFLTSVMFFNSGKRILPLLVIMTGNSHLHRVCVYDGAGWWEFSEVIHGSGLPLSFLSSFFLLQTLVHDIFIANIRKNKENIITLKIIFYA